MGSGHQIIPPLRTDQFDFHLPQELIAQHPIEGPRDSSRLLVYERHTGQRKHLCFRDHLKYCRAGDLLIMNNSRVIPARLRGTKRGTGGQIEIFMLEETSPNHWLVMLKPGKRTPPGTTIEIMHPRKGVTGLSCRVESKTPSGHFQVIFEGPEPNAIENQLDELGEIPLPPYIRRSGAPSQEDADRYQTVYADQGGSVAAPTAGLHYTPNLLEAVRSSGVQIGWVTLHVGLGTFNPIKTELASEHRMHEERFSVPQETLSAIKQTRERGGRVIAVGTTSLRVLESIPSDVLSKTMHCPYQARTSIFIYPPHDFRLTDALITNFHLPQSSLMMLVSAFTSPGSLDGLNIVKDLYQGAIAERYRFFSFGDAMMIL